MQFPHGGGGNCSLTTTCYKFSWTDDNLTFNYEEGAVIEILSGKYLHFGIDVSVDSGLQYTSIGAELIYAKLCATEGIWAGILVGYDSQQVIIKRTSHTKQTGELKIFPDRHGDDPVDGYVTVILTKYNVI